MIIVTGGAGLIGSNIVKALNNRGENDIIVVDNLENGRKFLNIVDCDIADYIDKRTFLARVQAGETFGDGVQALFHLGACSATTEWNGLFVMDNNYEYTKTLFHYCQDKGIQFIYASSAATYGMGAKGFTEKPACEGPLNVYGYSKLQFDNYLRRQSGLRAQVVGFRYFNVYGPRECHKGGMSSVAFHNNTQMLDSGQCRLFEGSQDFVRDFIFVGDAARANLWMLDHPEVSGVFNLGTGRSESFMEVSRAVVNWHGKDESSIKMVPFPDHLKGAYQAYTQADISKLRAVGYDAPFLTVAEGVKQYLDELNSEEAPLWTRARPA